MMQGQSKTVKIYRLMAKSSLVDGHIKKHQRIKTKAIDKLYKHSLWIYSYLINEWIFGALMNMNWIQGSYSEDIHSCDHCLKPAARYFPSCAVATGILSNRIFWELLSSIGFTPRYREPRVQSGAIVLRAMAICCLRESWGRRGKEYEYEVI